ncbi:MAG: type 1 periplasmic-binding domain-containing protein [Candidatus Dormibacteria bacterium]
MSSDPTFQVAPRKFGIFTSVARGGTELQAALSSRCGTRPPIYYIDDSSSANVTSGVARLKADGVTTILSATDVVMREAPKQAYAPEYVVDDRLGTGFSEQPSRNSQVPSTEWNRLFGITDHWRWRAAPQPYWYQAVQQQDPTFVPDDYLGSSVYYGLMMAFTAIQMAGPNLTAGNAAAAMSQFTAANDPPFSPRASYSPGDYTFVDDFMIEKFDTSGNPPGGPAGSGCFRLPDGGRRYVSDGAWPPSDRAAEVGPSDPCQPQEISLGSGSADTSNQ